MVNRCSLCKYSEGIPHHILIHVGRAQLLWNIFFAILYLQWFFEKQLRIFYWVGMGRVWILTGKRCGEGSLLFILEHSRELSMRMVSGFLLDLIDGLS